MNIELIYPLILVLLLASPAIIFFWPKKKRSTDSIKQSLAQRYNLPNVENISTIKSDPRSCVIVIDKISSNKEIISLATVLKIPAGQQQTYQMNLNQHHKFYTSYLDRRWDMAIVIANSLKTAWNGNMKTYYETMVSRCNHYKLNPPSTDWNGVWFKQ